MCMVPQGTLASDWIESSAADLLHDYSRVDMCTEDELPCDDERGLKNCGGTLRVMDGLAIFGR